MGVFLDATGVSLLWNIIKSNFVLSTKKASTSELGLVKDGDGVSVDGNGVLSLDKASVSQLGGVKIGANIQVAADGTISVPDAAAPANNATITIKKNGAVVDSFTTNQGTDKAIDITVPTESQVESIVTGKGYQTESQVESIVLNAISGLGTVYTYRGSKASLSEIEAIADKKAGDVWNDQSTGMNYAWTGTAWDALGSTIDTPLTEAEINAATPIE